MFGFGTGELLLVSFIMLLLFGKRLPGVMKSLGQSVNSFRQGMQEETVDDQHRIA